MLETVLIVAKCIVNGTQLLKNVQDYVVLIVAKCIVNHLGFKFIYSYMTVLIVAKCIVNGGSIAAVPANWKY